VDMPDQPSPLPGPGPGPDADDAQYAEWAKARLDRMEAADRAAFPPERAAAAQVAVQVMAALTEETVPELAALPDDHLAEALLASRRRQNRLAYLRTVATAERARRRQAERDEARSSVTTISHDALDVRARDRSRRPDSHDAHAGGHRVAG
jgi:hypothetical protein